MKMNKKPFVVLMAEDNEHDILATRRAWRKGNIANPLYIVRDGEECLDYLHRRGKYSEPDAAPRPGILLLDIKMPKMDGLAVLKHIREDKDFENKGLRHLPIIILTTSHEEEDRLKSYDLGVNAYITKPVGFENLAEAVRAINLFWELVELPE
jgi:CheY-like chemotaxis protein